MLPDSVRHYLLEGLEATPFVLERLVVAISERESNHRRDPERFTIRKVVAHLADWEAIWLERMVRMRWHESPRLQGYDPDELAREHNYAGTVVVEQLERFRAGREDMLRMLYDLEPEDWSRPAIHDEWGSLTISDLATLILGHDSYHLRQVAEWRTAAA